MKPSPSPPQPVRALPRYLTTPEPDVDRSKEPLLSPVAGSNSSSGYVSFGVIGGTEGGTSEQGRGGSRAPATPTMPTMPVPIGGRMLQLPYTRAALEAHISGRVAVAVLVTQNGRVATTRIVRGIGYGLDEIALKKAKELRFKPALNALGNPRSMQIVWTFHFRNPRK